MRKHTHSLLTMSLACQSAHLLEPHAKRTLAVGTYLGISAFVDVTVGHGRLASKKLCLINRSQISISLVICLRRRLAGFSASTDSVLRRLITLEMRTACYTAGEPAPT